MFTYLYLLCVPQGFSVCTSAIEEIEYETLRVIDFRSCAE